MKTIIAMLIAGVFLGAGPAFSAAETAGGNKESTRSGGKSADADAGGVPPEAEQGDKAEAAPQYGLVKGYRGTTLPVGGDQALYLKKGDRVDVLVTFDAATKEAKEKVTATILQNVLVLGVGSNLGQGLSGSQAKSKAAAEAADNGVKPSCSARA